MAISFGHNLDWYRTIWLLAIARPLPAIRWGGGGFHSPPSCSYTGTLVGRMCPQRGGG